eukprot:241287-Pyramimonas_sp.AAC.1
MFEPKALRPRWVWPSSLYLSGSGSDAPKNTLAWAELHVGIWLAEIGHVRLAHGWLDAAWLRCGC